MNKFLDTYNLPILNQEDVNNIYRTITKNEIAAIINSIISRKSLGPDGFTSEFYKALKEEITVILFKIFQNTRHKESLKNSFETSISGYQNY